MDRLQSMRVFQRVVDEGGFAAAARKLDLDPAVVTRLVSDLERHLGARLLQRTTRRMALTGAGEEYLARLRPILAQIDEADAQVRGQTAELAGRVRVLAPPVVSTHLIAPALPAFHRRHPDIVVDIRALELQEPPLEEYDLTFANGAAPLPTDVVVREVAKSRAVLCAAPAYLKRHGVPRSPEDLEGHRFLRLHRGGGRPDQLKLLHPESGQELLVPIGPALVADHTDTLLRATLEGAGISSQPEDIAAPFLHSGQLRTVLPAWITNRLSVVAAYPGRRFLTARARVFLEHVVAHVQANLARLPPAGKRR